MPELTGPPPPPLGWLVAGFVLLAAGLAVVAATRRAGRLESRAGTWRALAWALVYGLCAACFARVLAPALLGQVRSPWLLALGDVIAVALTLFVFVVVLVENRPLATLGLRRVPAGKLLPSLLMAVGAAVVYAAGPWRMLVFDSPRIPADTVVFALLWAALGSAVPEELVFRGAVQGSLEGRYDRWTRIVVPALAFTAVRSLRYLPGPDLAPASWLFYVAGVVLPLGLWWGLMRNLAGGSAWPGLLSHFLLEFVNVLAGTTPGFGSAP